MNIQWKMVDNKTFTGEKEGYELFIKVGAALGAPYWSIRKNDVLIDNCYHHSPTKCDLTAKVQVERVLDKILKQNNKQ